MCIRVGIHWSWRNGGSWLLSVASLYLIVSLQMGLSRTDTSTPQGACVNGTCPEGLCCSESNYCGADANHCGAGCQSGPCYSNKKGQSNGAIAGIVVAALVVLLASAFIFLAWKYWSKTNRRGRTNENSQVNDLERINHDSAQDGHTSYRRYIPSPCRKFSVDELISATMGFSIRNVIGKGGFAVVYKGTLDDGRRVAIKRLTTNQQVSTDFEAEVKTLGRINYIHVVQLLGYGHKPATANEPELVFLVYEFLANKSLEKWIFKKYKADEDFALPWNKRVDIMKGTAKGLDYLHERLQGGKSVVHLDIKPQNILLTEDFVAQIADFGLSKLLGSETTSRVTMANAGTPGYMAPEQFDDPPNPKMDVYSFGMVLLEVISGRLCWDTSAEPADSMYLPLWAMRKIMQPGESLEVVDPLIRDLVDPNTADKLIRIGLYCLQENPEMRPNMSEVVKWMETTSPPLTLPPTLTSELESAQDWRVHRKVVF